MNGTLHVIGLDISMPILTLGLVSGLAYGLLAVGIVLVYRANRIINFAHGEIGAFGAAVFGVAVVKWHIPYWVALPIGIGIAGAIGAIAEIAVVRRLRNAPTLMSIVATLGVSQLLFFLSSVINSSATSGASFPEPSGLPILHVGTYVLTRADMGLVILAPLVVVALGYFFSRSRYGLAMRASATNPEAARMAGVFASRMSTLAWVIAGGAAGLTAILIKPSIGFASAETLGPDLLLRALAAAVIARMSSLPIALVAGLGVGLIESVLGQSFPDSGAVELALFVLILVTLLLQTRRGGREDASENWASVQPWVPMSNHLRRIGAVRLIGPITSAVILLVLMVLPLLVSNETSITFVFMLAVSVVALSIGIVTGLGGQLSLGQFALAGIGGVVSFHVANSTGYFPLAFLCAGLTSAGVSVLVGLPALRIRGLMLAVTTLSFALASENYLLQRHWAFGSGVDPGRPIAFGHALTSGHGYYLFCVVVFLLALLLARNIWRSGLGRRLRALRDNEDGARAFAVPATRVKLETFALAGFFAGVGGALYTHALSQVKADIFSVGASIDVVALTVIGGIGILIGPILGALYIIGLPHFVTISSAGLAATSFGWLVLILYFPGGLAQLVRPLRERILRLAAGRGGTTAVPEPEAAAAAQVSLSHLAVTERGPAATAPGPLLEVGGLSKRFGGVLAVDGVHFDVQSGETIGLIGPNGAGKTTLFEMLSGFTRQDSGTLRFRGRDIGNASPEQRTRLGIVRSFQDAGLFPTLTVLETVQLAQERSRPTSTLRAMAGLSRPDRRKEDRARELISLMGLDAFVDKQTRELSTGTRRITELACVIALEPDLLLLDEPSSGVAQRETEALGELLATVKAHLGATLIVIEHDMPLIMGISDRIVAMDSGSVIAVGPPSEVVSDPLVLESYLGGSSIAVARSGRGRVPSSGCRARTRSGSGCSREAVDRGLCRQHARIAVAP